MRRGLLGIGCVVEKSFEGGREALQEVGVPIVTLAVVTRLEGDTIEVQDAKEVLKVQNA